MLGLTFLCMVLLGVGFFTLSYRYQLQEIQTTLDRNAGFISSYADAALTKGGSLTDESFVNYIHSVVLLTDTTVLVCDTDGQVLCAAGSNLNQEAFNTPLQNLYVPSWAVNQLLRGSEYSGMTTFNQLLNSRCYLTSEVLSPLTQDPTDPADLVPSGVATGFLFVAADATSVSEFLHSTLQLFLITAMVVLLISLIICSITVQRMVEPLKGMCAFAHKFAHGEVDTRVTEYANRDDEIGELAIAFNAMADSLAQAEQKRSEFVANVSHELKTPLTSISGYAEIIREGMVRSEDVSRFAGKIYEEAQRLMTLVEDILNLSHLDEGAPGQERCQGIDLYALCQRALASLDEAARQRAITLTLTGGHYTVDGAEKLLSEIIFNLCDNAIKYNQDSGAVKVSVTKEDGFVVLTVQDTGIGIPAGETDRVFERFYRVDKSHSKKIGGTGLGLSIVKHAAAYHDARIQLDSQLGHGTRVRVLFHPSQEGEGV